MSDNKRPISILAVVAHPHDITHMCGTLAHHVEDGDSVTAVSMTGGVKVHREKLFDELRKPLAERDTSIINQTNEAYAEQKAHEMHQVCALFGVTDVRIFPFEDYPIKGFETTDEMVRVIAEIILQVKPHLILTHYPQGAQRRGIVRVAPNEHAQIGVVCQQAAALASIPDPVSRRIPHVVTATWYLGVDFPTEESEFFVDITDQAANRMKAEVLFASQAHTAEFAWKRINIGAGYMGWHSGTAYAEGWIRDRAALGRRIAITDEEFARAEMPRQEYMARIGRSVLPPASPRC